MLVIVAGCGHSSSHATDASDAMADGPTTDGPATIAQVAAVWPPIASAGSTVYVEGAFTGALKTIENAQLN